MKSILKITVIAFLTLCISSCGDDKKAEEIIDDKVSQEDLSAAVIELNTNLNSVKIPEGLLNVENPNAQVLHTLLQASKGLVGVSTELLTIPENTVETSLLNQQSHVWGAGGQFIRFTIIEESERYTFSYVIENNSGNQTGRLLEGWILKNNTSAEIKLYEDETEFGIIKWDINQGATNLDLLFGDERTFIVIQEKTGNLKFYNNQVLEQEYSWSDGGNKGEYINYLDPEESVKW